MRGAVETSSERRFWLAFPVPCLGHGNFEDTTANFDFRFEQPRARARSFSSID